MKLPDIVVHPLNATYDKIACEESIARELYDYFSFKQPNAEWMKRKIKRLRSWDGFVHLFTQKGHRLYAGLRSRLEKFASDRNYTIEYENEWVDTEFSRHEALEFIKTLGLPFEPREHQIDAFVKCIRKGRQLILSPTSSGKSLIIYMLTRYYNVPTLIIVPTINLVDQMTTHFKEYGYKFAVHQIFAGQEKFTDEQITISTWQSIYQEEDFANRYQLIIVDECHTAQASSIKGLMESATNVNRRFGFTGTLDDSETHRLTLEGLFGEVSQFVTTAQLIEQGHVSDLFIKCLLLKYKDEDRNIMKGKLEYAQELDFIVQHPGRKRYLNNLIKSLKGNKIVLFRLVEKQGKVLYNELKNEVEELYYISGETPGEEREQIRQILAKSNNATLLGSYGCVSTGLDAPSLEHVIFASPYKSKIKVLQSIGRGIRKFKDKTCTVYDVADDLTYKKKMNFALMHFIERVRHYNMEKFKYKIYKIQLK